MSKCEHLRAFPTQHRAWRLSELDDSPSAVIAGFAFLHIVLQVRTRDAWNQKKLVAEDSLRQFVEPGSDVLEPGSKSIPGTQ